MPAKNLPISPLADTCFSDARIRWKSSKPAVASHNPTKFRRRLARNSFARILATPNRWCPTTRARLPQAFLQGFKLMAYPDTGEPWWVPLHIDQTQPSLSISGTSISPGLSNTGADMGGAGTGPTAYALALGRLMHSFSDAAGKYRRSYMGFFRMTRSADLLIKSKGAIWRSDMDAHILHLMRRRVYENLLYLARHCKDGDRRYLLSYTSYDQLLSSNQVGCVLKVGSTARVARGSESHSNNGGPGAQVPTYELCKLLGDQFVAQLSEVSPLFCNGCLIIVRGQRTVSVQEYIWLLQGYLS